MPLLPASSGTFYGILINLRWEQSKHPDPNLMGLTFIQIRVILMIDIGLPSGPVYQEFVILYVWRDGRTMGPLPPPPEDNDGGFNGIE
ncbi:hypothetical protein ACJRO7_010526 [Eucalyptus globulus]|uniref:Uncharacterized protein n=1 Tax=Eucalyptus globulus TaxID=34317 RepID=A0ABD3LD26_EUCGL